MLGKRLKDLRGKRTQNEIAELLNISRARYSHYENDIREPDIDTLRKIAEIYNVSVDYLLGKGETRKNDTTINKDELEEAEFQAFANDPELEMWYKELPKNSEEELRNLRTIWEMIKKNDKK